MKRWASFHGGDALPGDPSRELGALLPHEGFEFLALAIQGGLDPHPLLGHRAHDLDALLLGETIEPGRPQPGEHGIDLFEGLPTRG